MKTSKQILLLGGSLMLPLGCDYSSPTEVGVAPGPEGAVITITTRGHGTIVIQ
jgi:hypothetical protein